MRRKYKGNDDGEGFTSDPDFAWYFLRLLLLGKASLIKSNELI
jgi:hypothetical protein